MEGTLSIERNMKNHNHLLLVHNHHQVTVVVVVTQGNHLDLTVKREGERGMKRRGKRREVKKEIDLMKEEISKILNKNLRNRLIIR